MNIQSPKIGKCSNCGKKDFLTYYIDWYCDKCQDPEWLNREKRILEVLANG